MSFAKSERSADSGCVQVLQAFKLDTKESDGQIKYQYRCCSVVKAELRADGHASEGLRAVSCDCSKCIGKNYQDYVFCSKQR